MKNWLKKKREAIQLRIKELWQIHKEYGLDIRGYSAFSNMDKMKEIEDQIAKLTKKINWIKFFESFL